MMDRRSFICAAGSTLLAVGALPARGQAPATVRRIGLLSGSVRSTPAELWVIYAPLRELGWIEGKNLLVERRYAGGRTELLRPFAEELVRLNVEIILTNGTDAAVAAKNATTSIPIIMYSAGDPVRTGLVASLARPGGNVTGYSIISTELDAKRLTLLHELLPAAQRIGVLVNPTNPLSGVLRKEGERVYRSLGMQPIFIEVASPNELEHAVAEVARQRAQAMVVNSDNLFVANRAEIMQAAMKYSLPTIVEGRQMLEAGGLLAYAISEAEQSRRFAAFIDKILRGAKPAHLPIEQPTQFELSINLKTAKALGITIPPALLLRADEVIR